MASFSNISQIHRNGYSNVSILGSDANNVFHFEDVQLVGITQIDGGGGDDAIWGSNYGPVLLLGGAGNDALLAAMNAVSEEGYYNETMDGGAGNDTLVGYDGDDLLYGGTENDYLFGNYGSDTLYGEDGNDTLEGAGGIDVLFGGDGDDILIANGDALIGGDGFDTAVFSGNQADYDLSQPGWVTHTASGQSNLIESIDQLQFDDGTVVINASPPGPVDDADAAPNEVSENAANGDLVGITALSIDPDDGSASLSFSAAMAPESMSLASASGTSVTYSLVDDAGGRFAIDADTGVVTVANAALLNYEAAASHAITIRASDGSQSTTATMTIALLDGNDAPNTPTDANAAANSVAERAEAGTLVGITASATDPNAGDGVTYSLADDAGGRFAIDAATGVVTVADGSALDYEAAASHSIIVQASDGAGLTSQQTFTIAVTNVPDPMNWTGTAGNDAYAAPSADLWTLDGGDGNDTLTGGTLADTLIGGNGDDVLNGGDGNDLFLYGWETGADSVTGGNGSDTIAAGWHWTQIGLKSVSGVEAITADGYSGVSIVADGAANALNFSAVTLTGIELIDAGAGNDTVTGSAGADTISGGAGDDTLDGGAGNDLFLVAGTGDGTDSIAGGTGTDTIQAMADGTVITLKAVSGIEAITAGGALDVSIAGSAVADALNFSATTLTGIVLIDGGAGNDTITGSAAADRILGAAGADSLLGGAGDDTLDGGIGNDAMNGGGGNDTYYVDATTDVVTEALNDGTDTVRTALAALTLANNAEVLVYEGTGNFAGTGNALANQIFGGAGNDTLLGGSGADTIDGGDGIDVVTFAAAVSINLATGATSVEAQNDQYINIEIIGGSTAADTFVGNAGDNWFQGGLGNDTLTGGAGGDVLDGGGGTDTASYAGSTAGVALDLALGTGWGGDAEWDTLIAIENVIGSAHADALTGSAAANALTGGAGDDTLIGGAGNDTMTGGAGNDSFYVDATTDVVTENANEGTDTVYTALGALTLANNVEQLVYEGTGTFAGTGNASANQIFGGAGNDTLLGAGGADTLWGGGGLDVVTFAAAVSINLATGVNSVEAQNDQYIDIEIIGGSAGADTYVGDGWANWFQGGAGNDTFNGGGGADTLDGGAGIDTATYAAGGAAVTVNLAAGTGAGGEAEGDVLIGIEYLIGSAYNDALTGDAAANNVNGGAGNDVLDGGAGNDTLTGAAGDDTLDGGAGTDSLVGGAGNDVYTVDATTDVVVEALNEGTDTVRTALASYTLSAANVENLTYIGAGNFAGTGSSAANVITGGAGNDTLQGAAGADTLQGGDGIDTASYAASTVGVVFSLMANGGAFGDAAGDKLYGIENLLGSNYADRLLGDAGANVLDGNGGDDLLNAAYGNDTLLGGLGNDTLEGGGTGNVLNGGGGTDTVRYGSAYTADLAAGTSSFGDTLIAIEILQGSNEADSLTGDTLANTLYGNGGNDALAGGGGNDTLQGGAGVDQMQGGLGNDRFVFTVDTDTGLGASADVILDFTAGQDQLDLGGIDSNTVLAGDQGFAFIGTAAFGNVAGQLRYDQPGDGYTHLYGDRNGDGTSDLEILLSGSITLAAANFYAL